MSMNEPITRTPLRPASAVPNRGSGWDSLRSEHTRIALAEFATTGRMTRAKSRNAHWQRLTADPSPQLTTYSGAWKAD